MQDPSRGVEATNSMMHLADCSNPGRMSIKLLEMKGVRSGDTRAAFGAGSIQQQVVGMWMEAVMGKTKTSDKAKRLLDACRA